MQVKDAAHGSNSAAKKRRVVSAKTRPRKNKPSSQDLNASFSARSQSQELASNTLTLEEDLNLSHTFDNSEAAVANSDDEEGEEEDLPGIKVVWTKDLPGIEPIKDDVDVVEDAPESPSLFEDIEVGFSHDQDLRSPRKRQLSTVTTTATASGSKSGPSSRRASGENKEHEPRVKRELLDEHIRPLATSSPKPIHPNLSEELDRVRQELKESRKRHQAEIKTLREELTKEKATNAKLTNALASTTEVMADRSKKLAEVQADLEKLKKDYNDLQTEVDKKNQEHQELQRRIDKQSNMMTSARAKLLDSLACFDENDENGQDQSQASSQNNIEVHDHKLVMQDEVFNAVPSKRM